MPFQDPANELRLSLDVTEFRCQAKGLMTGYRECGCRLVRVSMSPALQQEVVRQGIEVREGDLVCGAGTMCGIKNGVKFTKLLGILR